MAGVVGLASVLREVDTGVPQNDTEGGGDEFGQSGIPPGPINTPLPNATGIPWLEGLEDPYTPTGLTPTNDAQIDQPDVGWAMGPGAFEGAFRTIGPVQAWGHEVSGGPFGDQALGRRQKFEPYIPERYDRNGVQLNSYADELMAALEHNGMGQVSEAEYTTSLMQVL